MEAKLIQKALDHHREEEAEHRVKNFLWSLGIRKEKHFFEINQDYKEVDEAHIQKEALSVLHQDA